MVKKKMPHLQDLQARMQNLLKLKAIPVITKLPSFTLVNSARILTQ
tara:strand:+ start:974 stop:1111 length:138 start_codon:yes stop_codon:yes gene_type:complete